MQVFGLADILALKTRLSNPPSHSPPGMPAHSSPCHSQGTAWSAESAISFGKTGSSPACSAIGSQARRPSGGEAMRRQLPFGQASGIHWVSRCGICSAFCLSLRFPKVRKPMLRRNASQCKHVGDSLWLKHASCKDLRALDCRIPKVWPTQILNRRRGR